MNASSLAFASYSSLTSSSSINLTVIVLNIISSIGRKMPQDIKRSGWNYLEQQNLVKFKHSKCALEGNSYRALNCNFKMLEVPRFLLLFLLLFIYYYYCYFKHQTIVVNNHHYAEQEGDFKDHLVFKVLLKITTTTLQSLSPIQDIQFMKTISTSQNK